MDSNALEEKTGQTFEVPVLVTFEVVNLEKLDPEKAETEAKKLRVETLPKLKEQVTANLSWLEQISAKSREAQDILIKEIERRRQWLIENLNHEFGPYRRTTWLASLLYYFSKPAKTEAEAAKLLDQLCKDKKFQERAYLLETTAGPATLTAFGKTYAVNPFADLGEPEIGQLRKALAQLESMVDHETWLAYRDKSTSLLDQGALSTQQLLNGGTGLFSALSSVNGDNKPGGTILVYSDGRNVYVRQAVGVFQKEMEELKEKDKPLPLHALSREIIAPDFFTIKTRLQPREAELAMMLWKILRNGIVWQQKKERVREWRERLQKAAGNNAVPQEKFLTDKTQVGFCFIEHEGRWEWAITPEKKVVANLFFVLERRLEANSETSIRLVMRPPWLKEFLADCPSDRFFTEKDKVTGLPASLGAVLRSVWGQIEKRSRIQQQA